VIGTDDRFKQRLHVGPYDSQHGFTPWEIEFEGAGRCRQAFRDPTFSGSGESSRSRARKTVRAATVMVHGRRRPRHRRVRDGRSAAPREAPAERHRGGHPMPIADAVALLAVPSRARGLRVDLGEGYRLLVRPKPLPLLPGARA